MDDLKPCPFCGGKVDIKSNRDWHTLYGEHSNKCFVDECYQVPATDEDLEFMIKDWNTRAPNG